MIKLSIAILAAIIFGGAIWQFGFSKPVVISTSDLDDTCGAVAIINVEQASIFTRPSRLSRTLSALGPGTKVYLCDKMGNWFGVVVQKIGINCITSEKNEIYTGKCLAGWVHKSDIDFFAG